MSWADDKDLAPWKGGEGPWEKNPGPWDFTERGDVFGYLNNRRWSSQADAIAFCQAHGLPLDLPNQHLPCGHWHKQYVPIPSKVPVVTGKWVAAMSRPGTPYIYLYDIAYKAVIKLDTSVNPVILAEILSLDSAYALDCDMGRGSPGAQRGGYCMNKDGTRIWYLFSESTGDRSDCQLIEVNISGSAMSVVRKTSFPNLVPSDPFPSFNNEQIEDGCSNNNYTYWCTNLIAGRVIKIRNSDHSIVDDHTFNYPIVAGGGGQDEGIKTIDIDSGKLYWVYVRDHHSASPSYNACRHLIRSDTDLTEEFDSTACGSGASIPGWQNMIRIYSGFVLHHKAYHPSFGYLRKRKKTDFSIASPTSYIVQEYLQNILGVKSGNLFTLMYVNSIAEPGFLYCIDFSDMANIFTKLDISHYTGRGYLAPYDWDETSVSAMNEQTGTIIIVRYHNIELKNYVACFEANSGMDLICDEGLDYMTSIAGGNEEMISDEPMIWSMPG